MRKSLWIVLTIVLAGSLSAASAAFGDSVTGGAAFGGTFTVNSGGVFFNATGTGTETTQNPIAPGSPNTGSFTGLSGGSITNITGPPPVGSHPITEFITFNTSSGAIFFDLQTILPGTGMSTDCISAPGSVCTPVGSPLTLTQETSNVVALSFALDGIAYAGTSTSGSSSANVVFTAQAANETITGLLNAFATTGFTDTYSATANATPTAGVPEPGTVSLMFSGLLGLGLLVGVKRYRGNRLATAA